MALGDSGLLGSEGEGQPGEIVGTEDSGRIPAPGQLPTEAGRLWAGRKQPPEARGTWQTRVSGNEPDPEPFLPARPVPLAACRLPALSLQGKRKLGWSSMRENQEGLEALCTWRRKTCWGPGTILSHYSILNSDWDWPVKVLSQCMLHGDAVGKPLGGNKIRS